MNIIVCLEDKNGMMFNKRRLSQDVAIREDIYKNMDGKSLIMNDYSYKMFSKDEPNFEPEIDKMIVYYWNRRYPSDLKFDIDFSNGKWEIVSEKEFEGNSHDKITKKIILKK